MSNNMPNKRPRESWDAVSSAAYDARLAMGKLLDAWYSEGKFDAGSARELRATVETLIKTVEEPKR